jgi:hypothetical protein
MEILGWVFLVVIVLIVLGGLGLVVASASDISRYRRMQKM